MTTRTRAILGWIPAILVCAFIILASAAPKLFATAALEPFARSLGIWEYLIPVGILELVCAVLFLIPRTATIGFVLFTGLLGGATAVSLTHPDNGSWPWFPLVILALLMVSAYFRCPELLSRVLGRSVPDKI